MPTATKTKPTPTKTSAAKKVAATPVKKSAPVPRGGRPRTYEERRQIQIRLPEDVRERLDDEANRRRVSKNYLIEQMIVDQLPAWEAQDISF